MEEEKKEKKIIGFGSKNSLLLIALILVIIVRLYFFFMTLDQPLWWDESEYMAGAKAYANIVDYQLPGIRTPGLSLLATPFFMLGLGNDFILRLFLTLIPSLIVLFLTYYVTKEMYGDNNIAIVAMLIMTFIWEHIFYSNRFHTENLALIFQYLAILVLFKSYVKKEKTLFITPKLSLLFVLVFSIIAILFRPGNLIYLPSIILFVPFINFNILKENKNKTYIGLIVLFLIGLIVLFNLSKIPILSSYYHPDVPISFKTLGGIYGLYGPSSIIPGLLFYFFLFGLAVAIIGIWLRMPLIKEFRRDNKELETKSDIYNILLILSVLCSFIFLMRASSFEYRWFFPLGIAMVSFTAKGIFSISGYLSKISKELSIVFIVGVLILGFYGQFDHSKLLLEGKSTSYQQVKDAGLWIKENSNKEDIIVSDSVPQNAYYSERKTFSFNQSEDDFNRFVEEVKPRYIVISAFENYPQYAYTWPQSHQNITVPVQIYFQDKENKQPILIIYEMKYQ